MLNTAPTEKRGDMPYRTLGKTGEKISLIGLGGLLLGRRRINSWQGLALLGAWFAIELAALSLAPWRCARAWMELRASSCSGLCVRRIPPIADGLRATLLCSGGCDIQPYRLVSSVR